MKRIGLLLVLAGLITLGTTGCTNPDGRTTRVTWDSNVSPERVAKGLVVILPGIEGESSANHNIRRGYRDAGVPYALAIYRWGFEIPGINLLVNQTDVKRARKVSAELAQNIVKYQQKHPGKPIFFVGHSGGGGIAIFTLEAMARIPGARPINGAILLHTSISSNYSVANALRMTTQGILNVANPEDTLLDEGTKTFGNMDGGKGESAGRKLFSRRFPNLYQVSITGKQLGVWDNPHFVATNPAVVKKYCAPWIMSRSWPVH